MKNAHNLDSSHDFGRDILPKCISGANLIAYEFRDLNQKTIRYWRDVGTLDAYGEANMDLVSVVPEFNLYDKKWPARRLYCFRGSVECCLLGVRVNGYCEADNGRIRRAIILSNVILS